MSIYAEIDPQAERRTQFAFKGKREHIMKVNTPNIAYPSQTFDVEIPTGSSEHVIVPESLKVSFNLDLETSKDKGRYIVKNIGRALVAKKVLSLGSKEIETIANSDVYDTFKDLWLSKKEREDRLLQGIQSGNGLKARVGATKPDGTGLTFTPEESALKKTLSNRFCNVQTE